MQLVSVAEAVAKLGLKNQQELLDLILRHRIPKAQKVFGWPADEFEQFAQKQSQESIHD